MEENIGSFHENELIIGIAMDIDYKLKYIVISKYKFDHLDSYRWIDQSVFRLKS